MDDRRKSPWGFRNGGVHMQSDQKRSHLTGCRMPSSSAHCGATRADLLAVWKISRWSFATITLWDVCRGEIIKTLAGHRYATFAGDGRTIATASNSDHRDVMLVDVELGAVRLRLSGHQRYVSAALFSADGGSKLASASYDGTCKVSLPPEP